MVYIYSLTVLNTILKMVNKAGLFCSFARWITKFDGMDNLWENKFQVTSASRLILKSPTTIFCYHIHIVDHCSAANFINLIVSFAIYNVFLEAPAPGIMWVGEHVKFCLVGFFACLRRKSWICDLGMP